MSEDYKVLIDDLSPTRDELIGLFNDAIKANKQQANTSKGIEVDVKPEWEEQLKADGSILLEYEKLGWRVMWYVEKYRIKPTRSWLSFTNAEYKGDK